MTTTEADASADDTGSWPSRLRVLLAVHFAGVVGATWIAASTSPSGLPAVLSSAMFPAQSCLLGVWLGLGRASLIRRCTIVAVAVACLATMLSFAVWSNIPAGASFLSVGPVPLALIAVPAVGAAAALLTVRRLKADLQLFPAEISQSASEGLQFSIRHLLLLVAIVAVLLGVGRWARAHLGGTAEPLRTVIFIALASVCWIAATLAIVWASLGAGRPHERMIVAILLSLFAGMLVPLYEGAGWQGSWIIPTTTLAMGVIVAGSLLVVRSLGYRLVRAPQESEHERH